MNPSQLGPCIRETIGWLIKETEEALYLSHDKSVHQTQDKHQSGLVLLKSDIIERQFFN
jgi:hypothetical protein